MLSAPLAPLAQNTRWLNWALVPDPKFPNRKPRKVPISPRTGHGCKSNDPANWCTYEEAHVAAQARGHGMAYVFAKGDNLFFLDIDDCVDPATGTWNALAQQLMAMWGGHVVIEVSQSGKGLHIFGYATRIPKHGCRNIPLGLELYDQDRFVALTDQGAVGALDADVSETLVGLVASYFPCTSACRDVVDWTDEGDGANSDDEELLQIMLHSGQKSAGAFFNANHVPFAALWNADEDVLSKRWPDTGGQGRSFDGSSADAALAAQLAYWCGGNCERMRTFMERSALARDKWEDRPNYLERTILNACATVKNRATSRDANPGELTGVEAGDTDVSEDTIAETFRQKNEGMLKFDHRRGKWFEFDLQTHWAMDERRRTFHNARMAVRALSGGKRTLNKASVADGVEKLIRADPAFAVTSEVWDADPMLLGVPGGTVDLRTGTTRTASPTDMITRITSVAPAPGVPILWLRVLNELFAADTELIAFIQRFCGYVLTGTTSEHVLLFLLGPGGNGKSTILNVLTSLLGKYAATATMETFMASHQDRHTTDLAMLQGARLVTASETESGRQWAEARVKALTGGDPITARYMKQDNFTFRPQLKLVIAGNHPPRLQNVDEAMRRRLLIVPFRVKPAQPDRHLEDKLQQELPQILSWCIEGCLEWQRDGLNPPNSVRLASEEYFQGQDTFGEWLAERCVTGVGLRATPANLFQSWGHFASAAGALPGDNRTFAERLRARGFEPGRDNAGRFYTGLAIKPAT